MSNTKTASHQEKVLDLIEMTGAIIEKTSADLTTKEAHDKKVAALIPHAVTALVENQRIEPHEKEAAAQLLQNLPTVLEILIKTAQHRNDAERVHLGKPEGTTKKASAYNSTEDNYVGRRSHPGERESDKAFKRGLGM